MTDLLNRLNELVLFKDVYPKMFMKLKKCGGGVIHLRCPHGVCVYMKFLLRQESARDHVDAILSFRKQPIVFISDIGSQVAHHGEARMKDLFRPNKGMLYAYTKENLALYEEGNLTPVSINLDTCNEFYSLNDRFHHKSKKKCAERFFRDINNCPGLLNVNTSIAEQHNSSMARDRYSVCLMDAVNFMFVTRASVHFHNVKMNNLYITKLKRKFYGKVLFDHQGRAVPDLKRN
ncbi:uncharacterized protein LOC144745155 [Ciona intestinalis]